MAGIVCPSPAQRATTNGPPSRIDIARIRREQIIQAAVDIIVEQGLHKLSLSKIEQRTGMKRGQLTYYFPKWEHILLAVFDRLLLLIMRRLHEAEGETPPDVEGKRGVPNAWECTRKMFQTILGDAPPLGPEFHALEYTFLAQITHREDFREKLASLYEEWRSGMAAHWQVTARPTLALAREVSPRTIASFLQAIVQGVGVQMSADPKAFDRAEMLKLCVGILAPLFAPSPEPIAAPRKAASTQRGRVRRAKEVSS
jgi:AcrR family transcriptional regulator